MSTPIKDCVQMVVRCSPELRLALEQDASRNHRSRERHLLFILEDYVKRKRLTPGTGPVDPRAAGRRPVKSR